MLARVLLLGLLALVGLSFPAWATGPANYPPGGSGSGVVANTCTSGDFFSAVDGSGNFTCATPAGSGDVTAVGDCASGDCFTASSNNSSLIFEGSTADTSETTLTVVDPTADRTISLPNLGGTVAIERVYDVRAYGASCDGLIGSATANTTAIQAAIDAAEASRGGIVQFPEGTCILDGALDLDDYEMITLQGVGGRSTTTRGTMLDFRVAGAGALISAKRMTGLVIRDIGIRTSEATFTGTLIDFSGTVAVADATFLVVDGAYIFDLAGGVRSTTLLNLDRAHTIQIKDSRFDFGAYAIVGKQSGTYSNVVSITGTYFASQDTAPIWNPGDSWVIQGNTFQQRADGASVGIGHDSGVVGRGQVIAGNIFNDSTTGTSSWITTASSGVEITGNLFAGTAGTEVGVTIDATTFSGSIANNTFVVLGTGIDCTTGTAAQRIGQNTFTTVTTSVNSDCDGGTTGTVETTGQYVLNTTNNAYFNIDSDNNSASNSGFVFAHNGVGTSGGTKLLELNTNGDASFYAGLDPRLYETDNTNYVQLSAPTLGGNWTLTLPDTDGDASQFLQTDGSGVTTWATPTDTNTNAATICAGTTTYLDGEGNCDDIAAVYAPIGASYVTSTAEAGLSGEQSIGALTTGILLNTVAATTGTLSAYAGTSCTNQFPRSLNASGVATCASVASADITDGTIANADVNASAAILFSKLATTNTDRILGRDTAGGGAVEELTVSGGLEFTGTGIQRSALTGDVTASAGSNSTTIAANSVALTTDTTGNYAAGDAEAGKALYINATSCSAGVITASDGTPSCLTASSTPEFVSRVMTAGGTLGNYAVVMADGSDDDEVVEATTSTTQILGCSQDSDGTTSTNPVEVAVAGIARCKADTTVTAGSLVKLGATGEFALATTAEKTWGRAVTDDDGAGSAYILLFDGAEGTIDHALDLWTSIPDLTSNTLSIINANPTVSMTSTGTLNGVNFAPTFTTSGIGLLTGFNFQPTYSHSSLINQLYGFNMVGTYTSTDASAAMVASIMRNNATYTSATAAAEPFSSLLAVDDKPVVSFTAATTGTSTPVEVTTVTHAPAISINDPDGATGGLAAMTLTNDIGLTMSGTYTETSGTLAVTNRVGFQYNEVTNTSSATAITNNIGVDIAALGAAGATTNIGIRNADTTVYTPCTDDISSNTDYLAAPACTVVNLTAGGVRDLTAGTDQIANGVDGQIVTYFFSGSNSIAFNDGDNLNLTGTITLSAGDTLMLVYSSTTGDWMQLGTSNN